MPPTSPVPPHGDLPTGLYESVVTDALLRRLAARPDLRQHIAAVDPADEPDVLARHLGHALLHSLREPAATPHGTDARAGLTERILELLDARNDAPVDGVRQLMALTAGKEPGTTNPIDLVRPRTPLTDVALLTNAHGDPSLGSELKAEIDTSDGVDLICAFVKWHGLRTLTDQLERLARRGAPLRVVTTTYLGGTDAKALDRLARDFGAEIRVQYDPRRTRLHAKGWLFRRRTGFDTAYVGSSNLTVSALVDGAEWNVRLSTATPTLLDKFRATFEAYWNSEEYLPYDPESEFDREALQRALSAEKGGGTPNSLLVSGLDVRPFPHQQQMLEALAAERELHERHRNLVVAATGTGKTVVAALDYRNLAQAAGPSTRHRPSLLFVAHRQEILEQSLRTYREVMGDGAFGELLVGGHVPREGRHVFASVQSLITRVEEFAPEAFDVVVIDEFHHAAAPTYRRILDHLQPGEMLGLTATPERTDGSDVRGLFGGRTAAELRVWDAISADLLSPFHYFGIADGTDLRRVTWRQGRYVESELDNLFTGDDARARLVLKQVEEKVTDPHSMRALGFCAGVAHAEYMARVFRDAGLHAAAVTGRTPRSDRERAIQALRNGELQVIFTADLFNEGIDIPQVDTVLFLRPTESPTLFLQQLGRGLRLAADKAVLTALDFVGLHRTEFRVDLRFRALTGATRTGLERAIETGFTFLPSGCHIVLDRVVRDEVLRNVREHVAARWPTLVRELAAHPTPELRKFLQDSGADLAAVLRSTKSWTTLRRDAGLLEGAATDAETALVRRVRAMAHVDDPRRAQAYRQLTAEAVAGAAGKQSTSLIEQRLRDMYFFSLWPGGGGFGSVDEGLATLTHEPAVAAELTQVVDLAFDATRRPTSILTGPLAGVPLEVHASYTREEILAGLGYANLDRKPAHFQSGVLNTQVDGEDIDAFLITLRKSEADYSPTTMYRDYPISPTLFHWESQSTTAVDSPTGRRYLTGGSTVLLFVRQARNSEFGGGAPYTFLGRARYVSHTGDRPIAITWKLHKAMPADLYADAAVAM